MKVSTEDYEKEIVDYMKSMRTYRPEYQIVISKLSGMLFQYDTFEKDFIESGCMLTEPYTNKAGATNERKVPTYLAMESLRKDILAYCDRLYLNPKSFGESVSGDEKNSSLGEAIKKLGEVLK